MNKEPIEIECPKCGFAQEKRSDCLKCGIYFEKYAVIQAEKHKSRQPEEPNSTDEVRIPSGLGTFGVMGFVRDSIKNTQGIDRKPRGGVKNFNSKIAYALSLGFKEKEIFVFGLLQWVAIAAAYLLWIQMLDWIPEEVWRSTADSNSGSPADLVLWAWSFVCVGLAAFPIGILTGCMGAAHFLHRQGRKSTVAMCLKLVLPHSWSLWAFHWMDGWITVMQILERLPKKNSRRSPARKLASETMYYAWKLGISGVIPGIVTGNGLIKSAKNSIVFVKDEFSALAKLRAGYSALCWIVGVGSYIGAVFFLAGADIVPEGEKVYAHIYTIYLYVAVPMMIALAIIMLILRPIYVLALCDMYSEYLSSKNEKITLPENPPASTSALVAFGILCIVLAVVYCYSNELGIDAMLSTPYSTQDPG